MLTRQRILGIDRLGNCVKPLLIIVFLVSHTAVAPGDKPMDDKVKIVPNQTIQEEIHRLAYAQTKEEGRKPLNKLKEMGGKDFEILIPQLIYQSMQPAQGPKELKVECKDPLREAMAAAIIVGQLCIRDDQILRVLVPLLETKDEKLREAIYGWMPAENRASNGRPPDYSHFRDPIWANKDKPPLGLIRYMYENSPETALYTLVSIYMGRAEEAKPIWWASHVVSNNLWKRQHGFLKQDEVEPEAMKELDKLCYHKRWWVRLYVAEIFRQHPEFQRQPLVQLLKDDSHPLVRETIHTWKAEK